MVEAVSITCPTNHRLKPPPMSDPSSGTLWANFPRAMRVTIDSTSCSAACMATRVDVPAARGVERSVEMAVSFWRLSCRLWGVGAEAAATKSST